MPRDKEDSDSKEGFDTKNPQCPIFPFSTFFTRQSHQLLFPQDTSQKRSLGERRRKITFGGEGKYLQPDGAKVRGTAIYFDGGFGADVVMSSGCKKGKIGDGK